jgi:DNA-binding response OmpR family regulator
VNYKMDDSRKILIVEDERPMANALKAKLTHEGFVAKVTSNGQEALAILKDQQFDLIMLDLIMPQADGWSVLEHLNEQGNTTPVIVATNLSQDKDEKRARALGAKDFLVKSNVPITEIVKRIKKLL